MTDVVLPEGTVTFLFSDIEGSTHLVQAHGDRWPDLLATHFDLLSRALTRHGGHQVGTRGDAVFVAFAAAADALAGALDAQTAVVAHPWPAPPIKVRIGIHTGDAVVRNRDYVGLAVHEAARICAAGHGGQVLCSGATLAYAGGPPPGTSTIDLGAHRLKDLPEPTRLHQLTRPGLPSVFAGVRADAVPGNLPKPITSFIGRDGERADAAGRLRSGARLLTLTGSGGSGKTRLALQVAADVVDSYTHGAWLVELAGISDPDAVPATVAATLELRDEHGNADIDTIATAVADRRLLLVLDNCEHVLDAAAALVAELLGRCRDLSVLATSQEALGMPGETVLAVGSLPDAEAVRLFAERAADRRPGFVLDGTNTSAVTAICRRLDGIPLAIELAAGRVVALSVEEIADLLHDQFRLLTGGSRAAMPRQQTLRAAVDWSYALLGEDEQILLARLAMFSGGWNLDAAIAVAGFEPIFAIDVVDGLARLVARSLVIVEEQDGASRYRMLATIRQYALERLNDRGEVAAARDRHAAHFRSLALAAEPELTGPEQAEWLARLAADDANLRAALDWLGAAGLEIAVALWRYWLVRGDWSGGRSWLERGLEDIDIDRPDPIVARALDGAGALAIEQGDHDGAEPLLAYALLQWRALDEPGGTARVLNHLGTLARNRFAYDEARARLREALDLGDRADDPRLRTISLRNLGLLAAQQKDHENARALYDEALPMARAHGDKRLVATLTHALSRVAFEDGDRVTAAELADEGVALARELGDRQMVAEHLTVLAGIAAADGDGAAASAHLGEALALWSALGATHAVAWLHTTLGEMALTAGDADAACGHLNQAVAAWREFGDDAALARILNLAGWAALEAGAYEIAEQMLDEAVALARYNDDAAQLSAALHSRGELARRAGDRAAARPLLDESLESARTAGWRNLLWWPTWSLAALARDDGRLDDAAELLAQAEAVCPKLGRAPRLADCKEEAAELARARGDEATAAVLLKEAEDLRARFSLGAFTMS